MCVLCLLSYIFSVYRQTSHKTTPPLPSMHMAESHSLCSTTDATAKSYKQSGVSNAGDHRTAQNISIANKRLAAIEKRNNKTATITIDASDVPAVLSRKRLCTETLRVADAALSSARTKLTTDEMQWILDATSPKSDSRKNDAGSTTYSNDDGSRNETGGGTGSATCGRDDALWEMAPYSYDIFLCVDNCELQGGYVSCSIEANCCSQPFHSALHIGCSTIDGSTARRCTAIVTNERRARLPSVR